MASDGTGGVLHGTGSSGRPGGSRAACSSALMPSRWRMVTIISNSSVVSIAIWTGVHASVSRVTGTLTECSDYPAWYASRNCVAANATLGFRLVA